jgi:DNA-directed RNA polymerase II subunit RPB2
MGLFCLSDKLPSSQNVVVGVYTHPNNQDDAIVMNRRLIDFGGYLITCDQSFSFKLPIKTQWKKGERPREIPQREWEKLGDNGIIRKGSRVFFDSPLACICDMDGKVVMVCKLHVVLNDHGVEDTDYQYFVRSVLETYDRCNNPMLLVKVTHLRKPQIGDKFASRSAQKGVVGEIRSPEDMIFTMRDGITPDIVINPHCMPSRQTLGQLITMVTDKSKALTCHWGQYNNLTPFNNQLDLDRIFSELGEHGEKELCIHPWTGEMIPEPVNIGIAPYQRLVHFSADKLSAVLDGDKNPETGAPLKGKKRMGGVRVGEMEQNVLAAHGVAEFQHEKMMKLSDGVEVAICSNCGEAMKAGTTTCIYSCTQGTVENRIVRNSTLRFKSVLNAGQITFSQT